MVKPSHIPPSGTRRGDFWKTIRGQQWEFDLLKPEQEQWTLDGSEPQMATKET
jgi:hypothetical protein